MEKINLTELDLTTLLAVCTAGYKVVHLQNAIMCL